MKATDIEWTGTYLPDGTLQRGFSSNPLKYRDKAGNVVWGCVKKSTGCANCYSEAIAERYGRGGPFTLATMRELTPFIDDAELKKIITAKTVDKIPTTGGKVFVGDMTDIFGEWVPFELIDKLFAAFAIRQDMIFQVLTKRPERMAEYIIRTGKSIKFLDDAARTFGYTIQFDPGDGRRPLGLCPWPLKTVWLGTSVENQATADERIPHLLKVPAAVRFLSCEPLLGPVALGYGITGYLKRGPHPSAVLAACMGQNDAYNGGKRLQSMPSVDWVIIGGESGPGARPMQIDWARSIVQQCKAAGVPCFVKQLGSVPLFNEAEIWAGMTDVRRDKKGGNIEQFPADLRVRDFPVPA